MSADEVAFGLDGTHSASATWNRNWSPPLPASIGLGKWRLGQRGHQETGDISQLPCCDHGHGSADALVVSSAVVVAVSQDSVPNNIVGLGSE